MNDWFNHGITAVAEAGPLSWSEGSKPPFSGWESWPGSWRWRFSLQLLHTVTCPIPFWRSQPEGVSKTLPAKSSEIQWFPNWNTSSDWVLLETMSSKIMNRTGDKGQPCLPVCTSSGNSSDLGLQIWTLVFSRGPPTPYTWGTSHRIPGKTPQWSPLRPVKSEARSPNAMR